MGRTMLSTFAVTVGLLVIPAYAQLDNPNSFSFDGVLLDDVTSNPMTGPVALKIQVYNPAANCLLFEEDHASVALDANGAFSVRVGTGTRNTGADGGLAWKNIFSNKGVLIRASNGGTCGTSYTPATNDSRKIRVTVNSVNVLSPDFVISSVPFATTADTLQGLVPSDLVLASGGSAVNGFLKMNNQAAVRFADSGGSNYVAVRAPGGVSGAIDFILPGTLGGAGQVLATDGAGNLAWATNVLSATQIQNQPISTVAPANGQVLAWNGTSGKWEGKTFSASSNATQIQGYNVSAVAPANNQVLTWNGTQWMPMNIAGSGGGGTVTAVTPGLGLVGSTITTSGSLAVDVGTTANKILQLNGAAQIPAVDGSLLTNVNAAQLATRAVSPAAPSANQVLGWNGTMWMPMTIAGTGGGTDNLGNHMATQNLVLASYWLSGDGGNEGLMVDANGRVGIGTNIPAAGAALDVFGVGSGASSFLVPRDSTVNRPSGIDGMIRYNTSLAKFEVFEGGTWINMVSAGGGNATQIQGYPVSGAGPSNGQILKFNGGIWNLAPDEGSVFPLLSTNPGTAAVPAYSFASDSNTGIFTAGADTLGFATNGTERMRFDASGNIGIGTMAPSYPLEVNSSTPYPLSIGVNTGTVGMDFSRAGAAVARLSVSMAGNLNFDLNADSQLEMVVGQKVGIGTNTPNVGAVLDINGTGTISSMIVPRGTTALRPAVGVNGMVRYNTNLSAFEGYESGTWIKLGPSPVVSIYAGRSLNSTLGTAAFSTSTTYYSAVMGPNEMTGTDIAGATRTLVPRGGTVKNLHVKMSQDPGSSWVYTLVKNGVDMAVTCTVSSGNSSCLDVANSFVVAPGDEIGIKLATGSTGAASRVSWAFELVSP